jgi:predicted AAA+ superfamily ATPase
LTDSFLLYSVGRFDIKGKLYLQTQQKYYLADTGLRTALLGSGQLDTGRRLENIIYLELLRRGNQVLIGKTKNGKEIDFVTRTKSGDVVYYQVSETMRGEETRERELSALRSIDDHNPKYILTLDPEEGNFDGIRQMNVVSWLLDITRNAP